VSQLTAEQWRSNLDTIAHNPAMSEDNVRLRPGALDAPSTTLVAVGIVGLAVTIAGGFVFNLKHALAAYEVGVVSVTAISLGAMFWIMIMHLVNSGWTGTVRRQFENIMMMLPVCIAMLAVIVVIEFVKGGVLLTWLGIDPATDPLLEKKTWFLNPTFWIVRFVIYATVWMVLASTLWRNSTLQDETGDRFLSNKSRFTSAWGMMAFALTLAFFAFDFLMAMDYRFFSTMWGVYYFANAALAAIAGTILVLCILRSMGRLTGLVTTEHTHDMGKLLFGFTVFWAYIAFSQYFLIWYSNIPEETAWYVNRQTGGWENLGGLIILGHFILPFLVLLLRDVKRSMVGVALVSVWILAFIVLDFVYAIRPMVYVRDMADAKPGPAGWWLDLAGVVGVMGIWWGLLLRRVGLGPLVAVHDPRLMEALTHKNDV